MTLATNIETKTNGLMPNTDGRGHSLGLGHRQGPFGTDIALFEERTKIKCSILNGTMAKGNSGNGWVRTDRCPTPYTKQYRYVCSPSEYGQRKEIYFYIIHTAREGRASPNIVPARFNLFIEYFSPTEQYGAMEKKHTANHAPAGEGYPVGKIEPVLLIQFISCHRENPSHRLTNHIQSAASASLWVDIQHLAIIF